MHCRKLLLTISALLLAGVSACEQTTTEGKGKKALTINKPSAVSLQRGSTAELTIEIERQQAPGAVTVEFSNLPDGVNVEQNGREITGNEATFVFDASEDASLVANHMLTVTIEGPNDLQASEQFELTVEEAG
jgi:hypothetical protein